MRALQVYAGARARGHLRERGLAPGDVAAIPAAAGGPKGLVLLPLDRYLFGHWLRGPGRVVHLIGASIGAWRMAAACRADAVAAIAELTDDYVAQRYPHEPGRMPKAGVVSAALAQHLDERLGRHAAELLAHPRLRLHVFTGRGRGLLRPPLPIAPGWAAAFAANAVDRRALGGFVERVVFSDPRDALPLALPGYPTRRVALTPANLAPAVQASCSIPFVLDAVADIPGAPPGRYWDGGITDYHLHLDYATLADGLVLYPHFGPQLIPGWLDKRWTRRHGATPALDNLVLLAPHPDWVRTLPGAKLPDRQDFATWVDDEAGRERLWRRAVAESQRLADEFAALVTGGGPIEALPLAGAAGLG
ncbi:MAG: patatin-like phospholipase family protein [Burkholderiales bacterium]|nr:patatin-like phospholipase family protein [Burkholderiales bacterium]MDE2503332.1 patatin-like phospholipase family protein [Burkholderiales bacterium]